MVEEICASGAYYIAVAPTRSIVDKASIVGSIGVLMDGFGFTGAMEKLGVERRLLTAGENKGMLDPFSPLTRKAPRARAGDDRPDPPAVHHGRQAGPRQAAEGNAGNLLGPVLERRRRRSSSGLADKLGNLDYVAREVIKAEEVIDYTPKENVAERLAKRFGASIGEGAVRALKGVTTIR